MLSRVFPILKRFNSITNFTAPVVNCSQTQLYRYPGVNSVLRCQKMSSVPDDVLNDPERNLNYSQLIEKKKSDNVMLIDVREHTEIKETGKLPGSVHIPLNDLKTALGELSPDEFLKKYGVQKPNFESEIIFSCRSGRRSFQALKTALELGYKKAAHYQGGWRDWAANTAKNKK